VCSAAPAPPPEAAIDPSEDAACIDSAASMEATFAQDSPNVFALFEALIALLTGGKRKHWRQRPTV
jgi:hypothetical protein